MIADLFQIIDDMKYTSHVVGNTLRQLQGIYLRQIIGNLGSQIVDNLLPLANDIC